MSCWWSLDYLFTLSAQEIVPKCNGTEQCHFLSFCDSSIRVSHCGLAMRVSARLVVSSKGTMGESFKFAHIVVGWVLFLMSCWFPKSLSFSWTGEHSWLFSAWGQLHKIGGKRAVSPTQNKQARDKSMSQTEVLVFCNLISEGTSPDFYHQRQVISVAHTQALQGSLESGPETSCHSLMGTLHSAYTVQMKPAA